MSENVKIVNHTSTNEYCNGTIYYDNIVYVVAHVCDIGAHPCVLKKVILYKLFMHGCGIGSILGVIFFYEYDADGRKRDRWGKMQSEVNET